MNYPQIMSTLSPLPLNVGGHVPPAPMGAPSTLQVIGLREDFKFMREKDRTSVKTVNTVITK